MSEVIQWIDNQAAGVTTQDFPNARVANALQRSLFFEQRFSAVTDQGSPEATSVAATIKNRRGTCVGLAIIYLALAQRLGLDAHAVATPVHLFIRVKVDGTARDLELLEGGQSLDDDIYRRRYKIDDASIAAGVFMANLTNAEVIAHLLVRFRAIVGHPFRG